MNKLNGSRLRVAIICHDDDPIGRDVLPRWAATFADVVAIITIREHRRVLLHRFRSEMRRVGPLRMLDVLAFRLYYRAFIASGDAAWQKTTITALQSRFCTALNGLPAVVVDNPNSDAAFALLRETSPDLVLVKCRWLLSRRMYTLPRLGAFVLHPGVCPEYRNAHGCFWALATRDLQRVGMTLLKVDEGIDTGPVYRYFSYPFDERKESHIRIQNRMLTENLAGIREALEGIAAGRLEPINVTGRRSRNWGQPWLSAYARWKRAASRRG